MQWYSIDLWSIEGGGLGTCAFCYLCNLFGVAVFHTSMVIWRGPSALSTCAFCYMWNLFSIVVFHRFMVNWREPWHMWILLSVNLIWCSGIPYIYGWLERGTSALSICAFCYMLNVFGVVIFHISMVNWRGPWYMCILLSVKLFGVTVFHTAMSNWRGYICPMCMCILLYVKHIWCSGIP